MFISLILVCFASGAFSLQFDKEIALKVFHEQTPALFLFYEQLPEGLLSDFRSIIDDQVLIVEAYVGSEEPHSRRLAQLLGIDSLPSIKLIESKGENFEDLFVYTYDDAVQSTKLQRFLERFQEGQLFPDLQSQDMPAKQYEQGIAVVVGHNYDEFVQDSSRHVLVYFYEADCDFCISFEPNLVQLASLVKSGKTRLRKFKIGKINNSLNKVPGLKITRVPTLILYTIPDKEEHIYEGDRTTEGMLRWLESKCID